MKKKYSYSGVEYNEDDNTFHLIQKFVSISDLELDVGDNGETVVSLKMGLDIGAAARKKPVTEKAITSAIPGIKTNASPATKKVKAPAKKLMFVNTETDRETGKEKEEKEEVESESGNESNYSSESESDSDKE